MGLRSYLGLSARGAAVKSLLHRYFHLIFIGAFFTLAGCLLRAPPIWDEGVYLQLAAHALSSPLNPFHPWLSWVPHPPLSWYLLAVFNRVPRMAPLLTSTLCIVFLFYVCRRLYDSEVAKLSAALLVSTQSYLLYSLVTFPDGPLMAFMALSVLSFLCWARSGEQRFLWFCGLGLSLASLTKYTAVPILLVTFIVWLTILRNFSLFKVIKLSGVIAVSLLPLAFWVYGLSRFYGSIVYHYSSVFDLFVHSPKHLATNLTWFSLYLFLLGGVPLISWARKRPFDLDSKLLLIYSAAIFSFFVVITPEKKADVFANRYSLPMAPALTVISARSLEREKPPVRHLILSIQFLCALIWERYNPLFSNLPFIHGF